MGVYAITGATTGIGAATRKMLMDQGHKVINIDIKDGDITADLAVKSERERALKELYTAAPDGLDCFISCAGVGPTEPAERILSLNFFGAKEMTEGAYPLVLKKKGTIVVVSSNSANLPGLNTKLVDMMCDGGDEEAVREEGKKLLGFQKQEAYQGSKFAIARWVRRNSSAWAARGVRMNAIAPGATLTPLLEAGLADPIFSTGMKTFPIPTHYGKEDFIMPEEIAEVILFLAGPVSSAINGVVLYADGGTDGFLRSERF